jgi:hypothetical protein
MAPVLLVVGYKDCARRVATSHAQRHVLSAAEAWLHTDVVRTQDPVQWRVDDCESSGLRVRELHMVGSCGRIKLGMVVRAADAGRAPTPVVTVGDPYRWTLVVPVPRAPLTPDVLEACRFQSGLATALQDEHLLTEHRELAVTTVTEQAREQGSEWRGGYWVHVPEHAERMAELDGEVSAAEGASQPPSEGASGPAGELRDPTDSGQVG